MIKCGGDATNRQIESSTVWLFGSVNISTSNQNSVADMVSHYGKITLGVSWFFVAWWLKIDWSQIQKSPILHGFHLICRNIKPIIMLRLLWIIADMVSHYGKITLGVYDQHNFWVCWIWNCIFLLYSIRNHSIISLQNEKLFGHDWKSNRDFDLKPFVTSKLSSHWYWPSKLSVCAGSEMKDAKIGSILIWYLW